VLLLTSALLVSIVTVAVPPQRVHAAALTFTLSPAANGKYGDVITFTSLATAVSPDGTGCSVSGAPGNVVTSFQGQVYSAVAYGFFVVGTGPSGVGGVAYTLTITCGVDSGTATFTVNPSITISPPAGLPNNVVSVVVYGLPSDTVGPCTITSDVHTQMVVGASAQPCTLTAGTGSATGTFTVNSGADDHAYMITVNYSGGSWSSGASGYTKVPNPLAANAIVMSPTNAPPGWGTVSITGGGFAKAATVRICQLSPQPTLVDLVDVVSKQCTISADGTLTASFVVGTGATNGHSGVINIVDGSTPGGPFPTAAFGVQLGASVITSITPDHDYASHSVISLGTPVTRFSNLDAGACSISSNPATVLVSSPFCVIDNSGGLLLATFKVSTLAPGQTYTLSVAGKHGDKSPASVLTFLVDQAITAIPTSGSPPVAALPGTTIHISGTGFKTDTDSCTLNSTIGGVIHDIIGTSLSCTVTGSTGVLSATFVIQAGSLNSTAAYTLGATGTKAGANNHDSALFTPFSVVPRIVLNPTSGVSGQTIAVLGSGFQAGAPTNCKAIEAWQAGFLIPSPFSASSCTVSTTGVVTGSFTIAVTLANGVYTIRVAGINDVPNHYDNATATFTKGVPVTLTISPFSGSTGTGPVSVTGTFPSGNAGACTIVEPAGSNLFSGVPSPTCTISSAGALTASFTVSATAQGGTWTVQVYGVGGGFGSGNFAVTPKMTLTPTSGESFASVSITGSGFSAADAGVGCAATLYSTPPGLFGPGVSCSISATTFQMTGTFVVSGTVAPGSYSVIFPSSLGAVSATPAFTKSASAFNLVPNFGPTGTIVSVSGTGFNPTDASCAITAAPNIIASYTCSITGGVVTGSFTVVGAAVPGVSTVTVTSNPSGTSKSAPFQLTPTIVLSVNSGRANTPVSVSGSNFAAADTGCAITSSPTGLITSPFSCVLVAGTMSGTFTVAVVSSGNYTVIVTGSSGDAGQAKFRVPSAATLTLSATSGASGTAVTASGSNFAGTTCQLTSSPGGLFLSSSCSLSGGSLTSGSGFTVSSGAAVGTSYTVAVTTNLGGTDTATASFIVAAGPLGTLTLAPTSGPIGTPVSGQATGFTTDTSCQLTATPPELLSSASCTITGGGNANVGFIVSSSANPGPYTVLVVGNTGKSAATTTPFTVTATPSFILSANPSSLTLNPGGTANVDVTVQSFGGFSSPVALVASLPVGVSGGLAPNPVTPPSGGSVHSTFSLVVSSTATSTTAIITLSGTGGGLNTATMITLVIQSTVTTSTATSVATSTGPWTPPKCVIATATFGSEVSPAVQFLRNFRDRLVLSTTAGSAFMQVFNAWYYSFSPSVAQFIANNDPIRAPIRVLLYPLLGILGVSAFTYSFFSAAPEFAVVMAGLVASSLIGLTYFTVPALVGMQALLRKRRISARFLTKVSLASLAIALTMLTIGEVAGSFLTLAIASSAIVLICVIAVPTIVAFAILRPNKE